MTVYIIIPTYNEEKSIRAVIKDIKNSFNEARIIIVDDASDDQTVAFAQNLPIAIILQHAVNRGQGAALKTGTECAIIEGADIIVHFDADGQFLADEIKDMTAPIVNGQADIVFGSRFLDKKSSMPWLKKNIIMPLARLINKIFFNVQLSDPQAGFRAFSREAYKKIEWQQDRMAHCSEIMRNAFKNKLRIKEVPITVIYKDFGQKFSGGFRILKDMFIGRFTR
ncbi:MAG: glycosyltransferase family 2 protein [Patescibacteria group bacterium]|jgi:glycosyltransferase involved in cell wall biosynthesis